MEHQFLEIQEESLIRNLIIYKKDNNLDNRDNLDTLPESPAVYAICGRVNGKPANCRHVGQTDNLQASIKKHFSLTEPDEGLKEFMQSIKIKELVYELLPGSTTEERNHTMKEWEQAYAPECNAERNKVF